MLVLITHLFLFHGVAIGTSVGTSAVSFALSVGQHAEERLGMMPENLEPETRPVSIAMETAPVNLEAETRPCRTR